MVKNWLEVGKKYIARNGNIGTFNGKWIHTASGIKFILEDEEGHAVGYLSKKEVFTNDKKNNAKNI